MFKVFLLLFVCWGVASLLPRTAQQWSQIKAKGENNWCRLLFFALLFIMVCFAGLRTKMNDTATYFISFQTQPDSFRAIKNLDLALGANPGFVLYQVLLRSLGFLTASEFIFITSFFVVSSYILFLRKYSEDFGLSIYLLIAMAVYAFAMGAVKQTLAMAIGIWAVDAVVRKKYILYIILVLLACTIHPYVLIFLIVPVFSKTVWSKQTVLIVLLTVVAGSVFGGFVDRILSIGAAIGDEYNREDFTGAGVNLFRLLSYLVIPTLSLLCRKRLKSVDRREVSLFLNLSVVSACFMLLAFFGGANMFGRMASYFDLFNCLALPIVLYYGMSKDNAKVIKTVAIACYAVFYFTYYSKYSAAWNADYYNHISLAELIGLFLGG